MAISTKTRAGVHKGLRALIMTVVMAVTLGLISWTAPAAMAVAPGVTSVSPNTGSPLGGDTVTIVGSNFLDPSGITDVSFGANSSTFTVVDDTHISAETPPGVAGAVDVTVTNGDGDSTALTNGFTYDSVTVITGVAPADGPTTGGTSVVISGANLTGATSVKFGLTNAASFTVDSATQITAATPVHAAGLVDVTVVAPGGTSSLTNVFNFFLVPTITTVAPATGPAGGGDTVTITGTNLLGASSVTFGGTEAASYSVDSDTQITAVTAPHANGLVDVVVTTPGGTATGAGAYTFLPSPTITSVTPTVGAATGGTSVTITGTNLTGSTDVTFGGTAAASFTVDSATQITATTPAHAAGAVTLQITNPSGSGSKASAFTFVGVPTVTSASPAAGPIAGGTSVTIAGTNFVNVTSVKFDTTNATSFTVNSPTSITATSPVHAAGAVDIVVVAAGGTSTTGTGLFTYTPRPTVTSVTPNVGPLVGGTHVTIVGTGFTGATSVMFDNHPATNVVVNGDGTQLTADTPDAPAAGAVNVVVTAPGGDSTGGSGLFTYLAIPTVSLVSPDTGSSDGGDIVTITGTGFTGATSVTFGGTEVTSFVVDTATQITAVTPAHAAAIVNVVVTTPGGASTTGLSAFEFIDPPVVLDVTPATGPSAGGTTVVITGTGFLGATLVQFGTEGTAAFTIDSNTQITVDTPASTIGVVDVSVTTPYGVGTMASGFEYTDVPTINDITPTDGPLGGGTSVVITGSNFSTVVGAAGVKFGTTNATSYTIDNDSQITAVTPAKLTAGAVDVVVTNPSGVATLAGAFAYLSVPSVTSISPVRGSAAGGTAVTITGSNFGSTTTVSIGGVAATSVVVVSTTEITAVTGAHAAGTVDVVVTNPGGSSTDGTGLFRYMAAATVTSIAPTTGSTAGGTAVTITGTNFDGATGATVGGVALTSFTVDSDTQITGVTGAHAAGAVSVIVAGVGGDGTRAAAFTYGAPPTVTSVAPLTGSTDGGTAVTITGTNFTGATTVTFGGDPATDVIVTATSITALTPAHAAGAVNVVVTTPYGPSSGGVGAFTFIAPPSLTSLDVTSGTTAGGTVVVITGTGFTDASLVSFGTTDTADFTVDSSTQITVNTPAHAAGLVDVSVTGPYGVGTKAGAFTFIALPSIDSILPTEGPLGGGTSVIITGTNFSTVVGAAGVTFGGTNATSYTIDSATQITAVTPAHSIGLADVVVTNPNGSATLTNAFEYMAAPTVTAVSPNQGPLGGNTSITITGTGFLTGATVTVGGTAATGVTVNSGTSITATTPAGTAGTANVAVTTPGGTSAANTLFTYLAQPTVTDVTPVAGPTTGGTTITITGTGFVAGATVTVGGTAATGVSVLSGTSITATTPTGSAGTANVAVTTPGGTSAANTLFTYVAAPTLTSASPSSGPITAGQSVILTGTNLTGAFSLTFGGTAASFTVNSATQITATAPAHAAGAVNVVVTTVGGTGTGVGIYTYQAAPTVTAASPNTGPVGGGQTVVLTGTNFTGATAVTFGGTAGSVVSVASATSMTVTTPAHAVGTVSIVVTTPGGTNTANTLYTYQAAPTVTSASPSSGPLGGSQVVTLTGAVFTGATAVTFGGTPGTSLTVNSATSITITTPAHAAGPVDVVVTTPGGSGTGTGIYEYVAAPTVTSVSPNQGPDAGGATVTITGTGFTNASAVTFGGTAATGVTVDSATQITATTPAHAAGLVNVAVTTPGGTGTGNNLYTYLVPPTVTSASPIAGPTAGGNSVIITGTGFTGATAVTFGGTAATSFTVNSGTQITATAPAHAAGLVDIVVTSVGGVSTTGTNAYRYAAVPTVTSLAPAEGPLAGGTSVIITGTGLTGASAVSFDVTAATSYTVDSATQITAVAPAHIAGAVNVSITTPGGSVTSINAFTYVVAPGAPGKPTAVAGDSVATVTVTAPLTGGTPASYTVTAVELPSATCTVTGASGSCVVSGLTNGVPYTFTSTATNAGGTSGASAASDAVTPASSGGGGGGGGGDTGGGGGTTGGTTGGNTGGGGGTNTPDPLAFESTTTELVVGQLAVYLNGVPEIVTVANTPLGNGLIVTGNGWSLLLQPTASDGTPLAVGAEGLMEIPGLGRFTVTGNGFAPGSRIVVWLASTPTQVGEFTANALGTFRGEVTVPAGTTLGVHTLQVNGFRPSGAVLSVSNGIKVVAVAPKVITSRVTFKAGSSTLSSKAKTQLRRFVAQVPATASPASVAAGLINAKDTSKATKTLAKARAQAVADYLKKKGLKGTITVKTRKLKVPGTAALNGVVVQITF